VIALEVKYRTGSSVIEMHTPAAAYYYSIRPQVWLPGVHDQTVSRALRRFEKDADGCERE